MAFTSTSTSTSTSRRSAKNDRHTPKPKSKEAAKTDQSQGQGQEDDEASPAAPCNISSTIDRLIEQTAGDIGPKEEFLPSATFAGARAGYYFGRSELGVGYHLDRRGGHGNDNGDGGNRKRGRGAEEEGGTGRRSVRFGSNSIQTIPARQSQESGRSSASAAAGRKTAEELLEEAERSLALQLHPRKTLSLRGQQPQRRARGGGQRQEEEQQQQLNQQLKSHILALEKTITKNQFQRAQFPDAPEKFMESELALHEDVNSLQDMAAHIHHYRDFVSLGAVDTLVALLAHDNVDITLVVLKLFVELLDPALVGSGDNDDNDSDNDDERSKLERDGLLVGNLALAFLGNTAMTTHAQPNTAAGLEMAVSNLRRLDETQQEELNGIDDLLTLVENLLDLDRMGVFQLVLQHPPHRTPPPAAPRQYRSIASIIATSTTLTSYLLMKLAQKKLDHWNMALRLHASEVLASILQHEDSRLHLSKINSLPPYASVFDEDNHVHKKPKNTQKPHRLDGMESLLQAIAIYRKKDPQTEEECEYLQNMFDALAASLLHHSKTDTTASTHDNTTNNNVTAFLEAQGIELMIRCTTEKVHSGSGALKVLFFAVSSSPSSSQRAAETLVEVGGLKTIFPVFMGRRSALPKPAKCSDAGNLTLLNKYKQQKTQQQQQQQQNSTKTSRRTKRTIAANRQWFQDIESHAIHIIYGLTRFLTPQSPNDAKARLLAKFVEADCEKCDRLVELCAKYDSMMRAAEFRYYKSDEAEDAERGGIVDVDMAAMNVKLSGGGDLFHRVGAVIAFVAVGSKRCHEYVLEQLRTQDSGIGVVKAALEEFASLLDDDNDQRHQLCKYLQAI